MIKMAKTAAAAICFLIIFATIAGATAQTSTITPTDTFPIPQLGSQIQFAENLTYTSATIENNTWFFTGLKSGGYAGAPIRGHLHISATNCTVTVNFLQGWPFGEIGSVGLEWLDYNVTGTGTQTFDANDLFPTTDRWNQWTVTINGEKQPMGQSWNYTDSKQLIINTTGSQSTVKVWVWHTSPNSDEAPLPPPAPALYDLKSSDKFDIPSSNGSIRFAVDGSFDKANLNGDTWSFTNLTLNNYAINAGTFAPNVTGRAVLPYIYKCGYPADLGVTAQDCTLTITSMTPLTWYSWPTLNYTVQGTGNQTFTFPYGLSRFNWTVYVDGISKQEGDGWLRTSDNQLKVTSATAAVSVQGVAVPNGHPPHPIISAAAIFLCVVIAGVIVAIAMLVYILSRKHAFSSVAPQPATTGN